MATVVVKIKEVLAIGFGVGLLALLTSWFWLGRTELTAGIAVGLSLGLINYVVVVRLVQKLLGDGAKKGQLMGLFALKMLSLLGVAGMCLAVFEVDVLGFVIGYAISLAGPVVGALVD